ncbi:uncharacterized protein BX663DRAFT_506973 [Cokeromyces recurvatus]|uniref:uncharacterized protein n=1 Tax=Cokeromyces recurvatus TaxID=90255 RepID=UPI00221FE04D|nr:uncharacterized protein BX663DRAFT_506973 [Cokeromyces recurvatus]KAI7903582.1 hypothetical protein BX663DRAFT_506973 [Cokeromyces recurvatus]
MISENTIEEYVRRTFTKYIEGNGNSLNASPAFPILVNIISANFIEEEYNNYKFCFIGEAAAAFVVRSILAKHFASHNDTFLNSLAKRFSNLLQVHKHFGQEIYLFAYISKQNYSNIINNIIGVLYTYFGMPTIEKLLEKTVIHLTNFYLNVAIKTSIEHPTYALNHLIQSKEGSLNMESEQTIDSLWKITLTCQLTKNGIAFSHTRIAISKQKARMVASKDILIFLEKHPEYFEQLKVPANYQQEAHVLPIDPSDYYNSTPSTPPSSVSKGIKKELTPVDWTVNSNSNTIHISALDNDDDDAIRRLSNLLLGTGMDVDMEGNQRTKKRPRKGIFDLTESIAQPVSSVDQRMIKQEYQFQTPVKTENVDVEDVKSSILAAIQEPTTSITPPQQPPMSCTYNTSFPHGPVNPNIRQIKEEEFSYETKVIRFFSSIFSEHHKLLRNTLDQPGQSKSVFLSLVKLHEAEVQVDITVQKGGMPHNPVFQAEVVLIFIPNPKFFLRTEGVAQKRKKLNKLLFIG